MKILCFGLILISTKLQYIFRWKSSYRNTHLTEKNYTIRYKRSLFPFLQLCKKKNNMETQAYPSSYLIFTEISYPAFMVPQTFKNIVYIKNIPDLG